MSIRNLKLVDGTQVPWLAFGTGTALYGRSAVEETLRALKLGFTHIDTAQSYNNEDSVGDAIIKYLASASKPRSAVYVTTKLGPIPAGKSVEDTLRESLAKLKLDHVDLFLVHNPAQHASREGGVKQVWKEMVDVKAKGLTKSIGVSNFNKKCLEEIIGLGLEVPVVNQVEYHPLLAKTLARIVEYHQEKGIITSSYGGLTPILPSRAGGDASLASARTKIAEALDTLAKKRSSDRKVVTQNQVLLKWLEGGDVLSVTTSSKESRLLEYLDTESLPALTAEERKEIEGAVGSTQFRSFDWVPFMDEN